MVVGGLEKQVGANLRLQRRLSQNPPEGRMIKPSQQEADGTELSARRSAFRELRVQSKRSRLQRGVAV
jgi:hypothetical protein